MDTSVVSYLTPELTSAFTNALSGVNGDVTKMVTIALPIGLGIYGLFKAIRLCMNFFNSIAN